MLVATDIILLEMWVRRLSSNLHEYQPFVVFCEKQLQSFQVEDIKQDYETGKDGTTMVTFKVDFDRVESLEDAMKANCSRELVFYKR